MNIIITILVILGLLKIVSLIIFVIIKYYLHRKNIENDGITIDSDMFIVKHTLCLIPSLEICWSTDYLEFVIRFLNFQYYAAYKINKENV